MNRETLVNTIMVALVVVIAGGSGLMVEKNLHDKEIREQKEALLKTSTHFEEFAVIKQSTDSAAMQKDGFLMYKGKMYSAFGDSVTPMIVNELLPNQTKVMIDGRMIKQDGTSRTLKNNEMINLNGVVMLANRDLGKLTVQQPFAFKGKQIAGKVVPYIEFNQADFMQALKEKRTIVLYFFTDWDPVSQKEAPEIEKGFNTLNVPNVVAFRVNYNDSSTDDAEKKLAEQYSATYQHTKVIIKDGVSVFKTEDEWDAKQLVTVITNNL